MSAGPILLYDGDCAFCARSVQFLLAHDRRRGDARFAAREGAAGRRLLAAHPRAAAVDSLVWIDTEGGVERAEVRYAAVLSIARYLEFVNDATPRTLAYLERLQSRPAYQRAARV